MLEIVIFPPVYVETDRVGVIRFATLRMPVLISVALIVLVQMILGAVTVERNSVVPFVLKVTVDTPGTPPDRYVIAP